MYVGVCLSAYVLWCARKFFFFFFCWFVIYSLSSSQGRGGKGVLYLGLEFFFVRFLFFTCKCLLDFVVAVSNIFSSTNKRDNDDDNDDERKKGRKEESVFHLDFVFCCFTVCLCVCVSVLCVCVPYVCLDVCL